MNARENILGRIRAGIGNSAARTSAVEEHLRQHPRSVQPSIAAQTDRVASFKQRVLSLASSVDSVVNLAEIPAALARYLAENKLPTTGVCWPQFGNLDWQAQGLQIVPRAAIGDDLVGITGAFCAIAETGTLMMLSGVDTPAATSLLPETHIAIVPQSRIVACMEDAWALLRSEQGKLPRAVNFISGPSRTADIEQTVTLGAHGPYRVHIVLVENM